MKFGRKMFAAALVAVASVFLFGFGGIGTRNLNFELRTNVKQIERINIAALTNVGTTEGTNGLLLSSAIQGFTAMVRTTSIANKRVHYPARLSIFIIDANANDTITCTRAIVKGFNQFGSLVTETVESIVEGENLTKNAFERVTSFQMVGCTYPTDATDLMKVAVSDHPSIGRLIAKATDLVSVCKVDRAADATLCVAGSVCTIKTFSATVDIGSCTGLSAAEFDTIEIRHRSKLK